MSNGLSPRINRALAEFEFDLWEALMEGELEPDTELKFDFQVKRQGGVGINPYEESVDVVVSIRRRNATD